MKEKIPKSREEETPENDSYQLREGDAERVFGSGATSENFGSSEAARPETVGGGDRDKEEDV